MTPASSAAGKIALVTGGARGIGAAIATGLVAVGAKVSVLDVDAEVLEACPLDALKIQADVARPVDCAAAVTRVRAELGGLDVLINNAGIGMAAIRENHFDRPVRLAEIEPEHWRRFFEINCMGAFLMTRVAVSHMVARGWGRVINVTTSFFTMLNEGFAPYGPAKAALEAASAIWAKEFQGTGVSVNVLVPGGPTDTRMVPASAPFAGSADPPGGHGAARAVARFARLEWRDRPALRRRPVGPGTATRGGRRSGRRADRLARAHRPRAGMAGALNAAGSSGRSTDGEPHRAEAQMAVGRHGLDLLCPVADA